jgi:hypothetical protein
MLGPTVEGPNLSPHTAGRCDDGLGRQLHSIQYTRPPRCVQELKAANAAAVAGAGGMKSSDGSPSLSPPRRPDTAGASSPGSGLLPPDPYLGPAQGKMSVEQQRRKLEYSLGRTESKAAQTGS